MFVFSLQTVLDYRKNIEERILNDFSEKKRELELEELKLQNLIEEKNNLVHELRNMQNLSLHVDDIARYVSYVEQVRENEKKQNMIITQTSEQLEIKRNELLEAVKKRKVIERLKDRHAEEYLNAERAFEQKNSDEMAVLKFGRREK
jgi:flagellar FliJ protein